ncbi:MAG: hypothetical protein SGI92_14760 [Bryobacteraceae bacterium]|nr:hypothetical protein [Bryobacteraceae bacterium]
MISILRSSRFRRILDWLIVFIAVAMLIRPFFKAKYLDLWESIESTFISDARFLRDHWPHPNWQPNWYAGTRTDYIYPPALRYGTAALAKYVPRLLPARAYHIYVASMYCFGIAAVYLFASWCSRSRMAGYLAATATALISPSYLLNFSIRDDAPLMMPYRLNVLLRYGEGPHMSALAWIPLALLFTWRATESWRPVSLALAAISCAMVVSNNFYGATSLAILFPILIWSLYVTHRDVTVWIRAAIIPVLAYGLTAFWLVPSYLTVTLFNMQFVSGQGNMWSRWVALGFVIGFVLLSDYLARGRRDQAWFTFLCGAAAAFFINSVGNHYLDFRIIGEPARLFPELDMLLILLVVELLRRFWSIPWRFPILARVAVAAVVVLSLSPAWSYLQKSRTFFVTDYPEPRVEHELTTWMAKNMPNARALPAGTVRFWYNAWYDLPQLTGGSEQGLLNPKVVPPVWQAYLGDDANIAIRYLQILGVDAVLVNGKKSREHYKDFQFPEKFAGKLPVLYDNGRGDTIYEVPRRYKTLARVVDRAGHDALPFIPGNGEPPQLDLWYRNVEQGPDAPTEMRWDGTDRFFVKARVAAGQSLWVAESMDANWRAYAGGNRVPIRIDNLGFMVVDLPPGDHEVRFEFPMPLSNRIGWMVTLMSLSGIAGLFWLGRPR